MRKQKRTQREISTYKIAKLRKRLEKRYGGGISITGTSILFKVDVHAMMEVDGVVQQVFLGRADVGKAEELIPENLYGVTISYA